MRTTRFFCDTPHNDRGALDPDQSRHLSKVLRLQAGAAVEVFDGKGLLAEAVVEKVDRTQTTVRLVKTIQVPPKSSGRVILAVSMAKGERFDWLVEKCTELGADHIAAVQYERTVKMGKDAAMERYRKIALAASKQCGRLFLPILSGPASLDRTVAELRRDYPAAQWIYGDIEVQMPISTPAQTAQPDTVVCIGPEGGFSEAEHRLFTELGAAAVCLNPNILRIETAAVAFTAVLGGFQCLSKRQD